MIRFAGCGLVLVMAAVSGPPAVAQPRPVPPGAGDGPVPVPGGPRPIRPVLTHSGAPKLDRHGDPLPAGAVARYGTVRLRHGADLRSLTFSFDGKLLLTASESHDSVKLWDTVTGKQVASLDTTAHLVALAHAGFVVLIDDGKCKVWLPNTGAVRALPDKTLPEGASPTALAVNPDGKSCAVATGGKVLLVDLQTGKTLRELNLPVVPNNGRLGRAAAVALPDQEEDVPPAQPVRLLYSPDGKWLAGNGQRTGVWLWDLRTGKRVRTYRSEIDLPDYTFSPDVTKLAVTGARLHLYALDSEEPVDGFKGPENVPLLALRFGADGKTLNAMLPDGIVQPLDAETGEEKESFDPPRPDLRGPVALAPGATLAAAVDSTGGITIWNPKTGKGPEVERLPALFDATFGPKGVTVLDEQNRVHTFDPATGAAGQVLDLERPDEGLPSTWDARSRRVAQVVIGGDEAEVHFVEADTKKVLSKVALPANSGIPHVAFAAGNPDRAALFHRTGAVVVNPATGKTVRTIHLDANPEGNGGLVRGALSPDGRLVALPAQGLTVWEVATGKKRFTLHAGRHTDQSAFSADGRFLAASGEGEAIHIYDLRTGTSVRKIQSAETDEPVSALALSADGKRLAVGFTTGHVTVWDAGTGDVLAPFAGHDGLVSTVSFSADGKRLVSCSTDGTAVVWEVPEKPQKAGPAEAAVAGFDEAFRLLGATDAAQAQRGLDYLYRRPTESAKQVADRVAAPAPTPEAKLAQFVADLGSEDFQTREAAVAALEKVSGEAAPLLREAAAKSADAEVRKLANELLGKLEALATRPDDLRALRAVEVLEGLRTPEARAVLEKWAAGPRGHRLTAEAAAAVARLKAADGK